MTFFVKSRVLGFPQLVHLVYAPSNERGSVRGQFRVDHHCNYCIRFDLRLDSLTTSQARDRP